jgi:alpha-D-xyloside xylohydrolase
MAQASRVHSPSPTPEPAATLATRVPSSAADQPILDVFKAQLSMSRLGSEALAANPFLQGLAIWDTDGQRVGASHVLTATLLEGGDDGVRRAGWSLGSSGGITLSVVATQIAEGTLSVVVTPTQPADVAAMGVCLPAEADEHFYGLGERFDHLDLAGHVVHNQTAEEVGLRTTYAPATFLLSSQGYGLHLDTMAHATFDLRTYGRDCYQVRDDGATLHLYFFAGPDPQDVIERHAQFVGLPPLPPEWAFGVWKNLIGGQERVLEDLQRLVDAGVPLDAVWVYDAVVEMAGFGWPWQIYGPIPPGPYPDLPGLIDQLHGMDLKVLGYLNPFVYPDWQGYDEARQAGYLVQTPGGEPYLQEWTFGQRAYVDFTSPEATRWWQSRVRYALTEVGFDGSMLDFGEDAPHDARYAGVQPGHLMDNMYPMLYHKAAHEAGQAAKPGDFAFLARAGYSGSQPYTTGRFTGDQVRSSRPSSTAACRVGPTGGPTLRASSPTREPLMTRARRNCGSGGLNWVR